MKKLVRSFLQLHFYRIIGNFAVSSIQHNVFNSKLIDFRKFLAKLKNMELRRMHCPQIKWNFLTDLLILHLCIKSAPQDQGYHMLANSFFLFKRIHYSIVRVDVFSSSENLDFKESNVYKKV